MVLAALGACSSGLTDTSLPASQEELAPVRVAVGTGAGSESRSVNPNLIERFVDAYEVLFKDTAPVGTGKTYYRGEAAAGAAAINLWVLPGKTYEVLLLAGKGRVLLAAGYEGTVPIKAGAMNMVTIGLTPVSPQWDTGAKNTYTDSNDFVFMTYSYISVQHKDPALYIRDRYINLAPPGERHNNGPDYQPKEDLFSIEFRVPRLGPLIAAEGGGQLTITDHHVRLWPRYVGEEFPPVTLQPYYHNKGSSQYNGLWTRIYAPLVYRSGQDGFIACFEVYRDSTMPTRDVDALLQFDLQYYAFGTPDSGGKAWTIRNGIEDTPDDTPRAEAHGTTGTAPGSFFVVKIGRGSPVKKEELTIIPAW
jgi:hypothetical protein